MAKDFPINSLKKLAKRHGAKRISSEALLELRSILLDLTEKMTKDAIAVSKHAHRITIKEEDIKLVSR